MAAVAALSVIAEPVGARSWLSVLGLSTAGWVLRTIDPEVLPRTDYALTDLGLG